ncbi:hypothetical protein BC628DRAFT_1358299 [Trametes gibbosa]|nr:hypothetical protein BC628DRAFT_1358299 [Trametes gibbosa]
MPKSIKNPARKFKVSSKTACQAAAKQMQTSKRRSKANARISQSQAANTTAQINGEFARVQSLLVGKVERRPQETQHSTPLPENSMQDLTDVLGTL